MNNKLIIFPTKKQLEYLGSKNLVGNFYVLTRDKERVEQKNIRYITGCDENILNNDMDVLCCHEEGMYWLRIHGRIKWKHIFSTDMINLVTKKYLRSI